MRNRNDSNDNENYNNHLPAKKEENQIAKVSQLNFPPQHSDSGPTYPLGTANMLATSVYSIRKGT